ncbi:hypothetical protein IMSAG049_01352 [Clostridiales bacterium]|nr:hypothetical protein IMSAG049_01352 [Clostridiales bacterium]
MYHVHLNGSHYNMGKRFGANLVKHGRFILENIPFPITQDRMDYAKACIPVYQKYFPDILEEIRGLATGQNCDESMFQAVLFSMYAIPPACNCSCFAVSDGEHIILGRNSDFLTDLEKLNMNVIYSFSGSSFNFTGNTTSFIQIEDGINEHGLAVGLTSVYPNKIKPGLNAGMLLRFFLEKCKSTDDVINKLQQIPVGSSQTITVADFNGNVALIECSSEHKKVIFPSKESPFVCSTNIFSSEEMISFQNSGIDNWHANERFKTLFGTLSQYSGKFDISSAQDLLSGKTGFLCQYDRSTGKDTVWSVIYDLKEKAIYRAEKNPSRQKFLKDERFIWV